MSSAGSAISEFRLAALKRDGYIGALLRLFGPLGDMLLGLKKMDRFYRKHKLPGLDKISFIQTLLRGLGVEFSFDYSELERIPAAGRVLVTSNHPFGGIEGIILAYLLWRVRPDIKILANLALGFIYELRSFFIFTNPLKSYNPRNIGSIRACVGWLKGDGLLAMFPAGRVAFYHKRLKRVTDGHWNKIAAKLARLTDSRVVPVFISGRNSNLFYRLGRIYYRFRLLMLPRELLNSGRNKIGVHVGRPIPYSHLSQFQSSRSLTEYLRMRTYLLSEQQHCPTFSPSSRAPRAKLMAAIEPSRIEAELAALPQDQRLVEYRGFSVYYAYHDQIEQSVREIGRLREATFRDLDEGSGQACDLDEFDRTYTHLFIWDPQNRKIIGAYRMGQIDRLLEANDKSNLYLSQMFDLTDAFLAGVSPGLEMGRSFLIAEHQRSLTGLALLWRGIGEFLFRHPRYHTLYGTVSISTQYCPRSIALMSRVLVGDRLTVRPKNPFRALLPLEVEAYIGRHGVSVSELSNLVRAIEPEGTDIPILVKQYLKIGARFHSISIDTGFGGTPGALLSVDVRNTRLKYGRMYMGEGFGDYLLHHGR